MKNAEIENKVTIWADYRESGTLLFKLLQECNHVDLKVIHLKIGDFKMENRLIIERKTMTDFMASIKDRRLFLQAAKLARCHLPSFLLLEGPFLNPGKMSREAVQGALICLNFQFGIPLLRSFGPEESLKVMLQAFKRLNGQMKNDNFSVYHTKPKYFPNRILRQQLLILQGLPGIGPKKALSLLKKFGTVLAIFSADINALREVKGIDQTIAANIHLLANQNAKIELIP
ncbi:MAG: ERCC4 domain-containing protein [Cyclobacteriaceae bacterium]